MTNKEASDKQEKLVANYLGWKQVTGSGSRPTHPGDVVGKEWMGECKTHTKPRKTITLKKSVWNKICEEAYSHHKFPSYFIDDGTQTYDGTWVVFKECILPKEYTDSSNTHIFITFPQDVKDQITFDCDKYSNLFNVNDFVFLFQFDTNASDVMRKRDKLFLTKLSTFRKIINLE